jgi:RimJ/RimL family protein N-acetyltransferase
MSPRLTLPIRTARLLLRDFASDDYEAIYAFASDPEVTGRMFYGSRDEADTREHLAHLNRTAAAEAATKSWRSRSSWR